MPNILISGANKGIGRGMVEKYVARQQTIVIALVRDPSSAEASALLKFPCAEGSKVMLLKVDASSDTDAREAVKSAEGQGIDHLDLVIANAGVFDPKAFKPVSEMAISDLRTHFEINTAGPTKLFQATFPLLKKAKEPKFVTMSSLVGSIVGMDQIPWPIAAYGVSKAAVNFLTRKIHFENDDLIAFSIHPGAVKTDAGNQACQALGMPEAFIETNDSVNGVMDKIDKATKKKFSGEFIAFDDTPLQF